ncbi:hypothetical protein LSAT2_002293 [Lamellibrachia satsuma]|nr:hypothetical protein LSAT2_002293 [Lamellibrachia satsuma]
MIRSIRQLREATLKLDNGRRRILVSLVVYRIMTRDAVSPRGVGMSHTSARNYVVLTRGDVALVSDGTARGRTRAVAVLERDIEKAARNRRITAAGSHRDISRCMASLLNRTGKHVYTRPPKHDPIEGRWRGHSQSESTHSRRRSYTNTHEEVSSVLTASPRTTGIQKRVNIAHIAVESTVGVCRRSVYVSQSSGFKT